ncbi:hypothetical protein ACTXT7_016244 [Hymenolepis weldensis]
MPDLAVETVSRTFIGKWIAASPLLEPIGFAQLRIIHKRSGRNKLQNRLQMQSMYNFTPNAHGTAIKMRVFISEEAKSMLVPSHPIMERIDRLS